MAKTTKTTRSSSSTKGDKAKAAGKTGAMIPMSPAERAAAVDRNIGKSQPLHDFLASIGWR